MKDNESISQQINSLTAYAEEISNDICGNILNNIMKSRKHTEMANKSMHNANELLQDVYNNIESYTSVADNMKKTLNKIL